MTKKVLKTILLLLFLAIAICLYCIYSGYKAGSIADEAIDDFAKLKPDIMLYTNDIKNSLEEGISLTSQKMDFSGLKAENPDIIAWLTIPGTVIDYPVLQAHDNEYYLDRDAKKNQNKNGALFLDYRCQSDFSGFNNIIYGHHMKSGRMFQNLIKFKELEFFNQHQEGLLFTPKVTFKLEIFAVAIGGPKSDFYNYAFTTPADRGAHLKMIKKTALFYREIGLTEFDNLLVLSTCSYEFKEARTLVIARLKN